MDSFDFVSELKQVLEGPKKRGSLPVKSGFSALAESSGWAKVECTDAAKCAEFSKGTQWGLEDKSIAELYLGKGPIIFLLNNGKPEYAIVPETNQVVDRHDLVVDADEMPPEAAALLPEGTAMLPDISTESVIPSESEIPTVASLLSDLKNLGIDPAVFIEFEEKLRSEAEKLKKEAGKQVDPSTWEKIMKAITDSLFVSSMQPLAAEGEGLETEEEEGAEGPETMEKELGNGEEESPGTVAEQLEAADDNVDHIEHEKSEIEDSLSPEALETPVKGEEDETVKDEFEEMQGDLEALRAEVDAIEDILPDESLELEVDSSYDPSCGSGKCGGDPKGCQKGPKDGTGPGAKDKEDEEKESKSADVDPHGGAAQMSNSENDGEDEEETIEIDLEDPPTLDTELAFDVTEQLADELLAALEMDGTVDEDEFERGLEVEQEHGSTQNPDLDVTQDDPETTAKIAMVHLEEDPEYYTKLDSLGI